MEQVSMCNESGDVAAMLPCGKGTALGKTGLTCIRLDFDVPVRKRIVYQQESQDYTDKHGSSIRCDDHALRSSPGLLVLKSCG